MSDMSFKQAKELSERLELSEISLNALLNNVQKATTNFEKTLDKQTTLLNQVPQTDNKIKNMIILISLNIGFIVGLLVSKYFI